MWKTQKPPRRRSPEHESNQPLDPESLERDRARSPSWTRAKSLNSDHAAESSTCTAKSKPSIQRPPAEFGPAGTVDTFTKLENRLRLCRQLPPPAESFTEYGEARHRFVDGRHCLWHINLQIPYKMTYLGGS